MRWHDPPWVKIWPQQGRKSVFSARNRTFALQGGCDPYLDSGFYGAFPMRTYVEYPPPLPHTHTHTHTRTSLTCKELRSRKVKNPPGNQLFGPFIPPSPRFRTFRTFGLVCNMHSWSAGRTGAITRSTPTTLCRDPSTLCSTPRTLCGTQSTTGTVDIGGGRDNCWCFSSACVVGCPCHL